MSYKNFSVYMQRQIDRFLRRFVFIKTYVNNVIIFFQFLAEHVEHLR